MRLFCFPYAGGSASFYSEWQLNSNNIELIPIEYPGHGRRYSEPLCRSMTDLVNTLIQEIKSNYDFETLQDVAFFGHSMGATVAYETAVQLLKDYNIKVKYLFLSSKSSPNHKMEQINKSDVLKKRLSNMGGVNSNLVENDELMDVFLPIIKSDYNILANYHRNHECREKLNSKAILLLGVNDTVEKKDIMSWHRYIKEIKNIHLIKGDHFYLKKNKNTVLSIIEKYLMEESTL